MPSASWDRVFGYVVSLAENPPIAPRAVSGIDTYKLIRALPEYRQTAFVFYTADGLDAVQAQVKDDPNAASTNVPDVLLQRILKAIPPSP